MVGAADAGHGEAEMAGLRLGQCDDFAQIARLERRPGDQDQRGVGDQADGREVLEGVERQLLEQGRIDRMAGVAQQQHAAIGLGLGHRARRDIAGRPRLVVDNKRVPQPVFQLHRERASHDVGATARRGADQQLGHVGRRPELGREHEGCG